MQHRDNPDVQPQRPGYCLYSRAHGRFFAGFCGSGPRWVTAQDANVYASESAAKNQAAVLSCVVTTVPRNNGVCWEWSETA